MADDADLDAAIMAALKDSSRSNFALQCEIEPDAFKRNHQQLGRVDRRLQALRKVGLITYDRKMGWRLANTVDRRPGTRSAQ